MEEEKEMLRAKPLSQQRVNDGIRISSETPTIVNEVLSSTGQPLDIETRNYFELRFGHDLSRVRVHTGTKAAESARAINALAYTAGPNVVFGVGQHALGEKDGQKLMAHELTHVMQQQRLSTQGQWLQRQGIDIDEDIEKDIEQDIDDPGPDNVVTEELDRQGIQFDDGVHVLWFQFDSAEVRQDSKINSKADLELAKALILQHSTVAGDQQTIILHGYASEEGPEEHNMALSLIRAEQVRSMLIQAGFPSERIYVEAHGRDSTFKDLQMNRRVEIVLRPTLTHIEMSPQHVVAVPCICHFQKGGALKEESIQYIASIAPTIIAVSQKRKVSPVAVAGAIAEEFDTRHGLHGIVDWIQDNVLPLYPEWTIDFQRIPDFHYKLQNLLEHDMGNANIHVRTALELVESGRLEVEGSPPTDAQVNLIIDYIIDERGMVEASAAVIEQGQSLFGPYIRDYDVGFQDAVLVDFFNIGYKKYYQENFLSNLDKNPQHRPCPDPNGDGCQVL